MKNTIVTELDQVEKGKLLLIGDLLIDKTYYVEPLKISPEAPVLTISTLKDPIIKPGGAGLAAAFAAKDIKDTDVIFYTAASNEKEEWLKLKGIIPKLYKIKDKELITKTRYIDKTSNYHIIRIDNDLCVGKYNIDYRKFCLLYYKLRKSGLDGIVLLDYRKGIFSNKKLVKKIIEVAKENKIPTYVDSRDDDIYKFKGIDWLKLNSKEYKNAKKVLNVDCQKELIDKMECKGLLITKGKEGAELYTSDSDLHYDYKAPFDNTGIPDVTGCGDVFDITFANNLFVKNNTISNSLIEAVNRSNKFAFEPVYSRI